METKEVLVQVRGQKFLNGSGTETLAKWLSFSSFWRATLLRFPGVCFVLSFLAFTGHLLCCKRSLMDHFAPEWSETITLLCHNFEKTVSRECCLSGCGFPPYLSGRLFTNLSDGFEVYGEDISRNATVWPQVAFHLAAFLLERWVSAPTHWLEIVISVLMSTCSLIE